MAKAFRKSGSPEQLAAEAEGLEALKLAGVKVPSVLKKESRELQIEFLDLRNSGDWGALGRMLARLHRVTGPRYGWEKDNFIGFAPQKNGWCGEWSEFWRERRLRPQFERAGLEPEYFEKLLENHRPPPSLLHGDLWSGNVGFTSDGPVIFDPAVYYGDREADLAMTELFGGFREEFYVEYNKAFPLSEGYETRKHLYNLYHLLNHLNLFGSGYRAQVEATLGLLRDILQ